MTSSTSTDDASPQAGAGPSWAIFDVDLTLTTYPTWSAFLRFANEGQPMTQARTVLATAREAVLYKAGRRQRTDVKVAALQASLTGRPREELEAQARAFTERLLESGLRRQARAQVQRHLDAGDEVAVATAAVDLLIDPLCDALGIETRLCTEMAWEDGRLAGHFATPNCYAEEKERRVRDLVSGSDGTLKGFYSDHVSDLGLLRMAARGVAVNPSLKLRAAAKAHGLVIEDWDQPAPA